MARFDLLIFDMDGVLHDSEVLAVEAVSQVVAERGLLVPPGADHGKYVGLTFSEAGRELERDYNTPLGEDFGAACGRRWLELMASHGLATTPGVAAMLERISAATRSRCIASNSTLLEINSCLKKSGLDRYFAPAHRFSGLDVAAPKPAPDLHRACLAWFDARAEHSVIFEDSPAGIQGGVAAGIPVIGYVGAARDPARAAKELLDAGARRVIRDWTEVWDALAFV